MVPVVPSVSVTTKQHSDWWSNYCNTAAQLPNAVVSNKLCCKGWREGPAFLHFSLLLIAHAKSIPMLPWMWGTAAAGLCKSLLLKRRQKHHVKCFMAFFKPLIRLLGGLWRCWPLMPADTSQTRFFSKVACSHPWWWGSQKKEGNEETAEIRYLCQGMRNRNSEVRLPWWLKRLALFRVWLQKPRR